MDEKKLQQLENVMKLLDTDYVSGEDFVNALSMLIDQLKMVADEGEKNLSDTSQAIVESISSKIAQIEAKLSKSTEVSSKDKESLREAILALRKDITASIQDIKDEIDLSTDFSPLIENINNLRIDVDKEMSRTFTLDTGLQIKQKLLALSEEDKLKLKDFGGYDALLDLIGKSGKKGSYLPYSGITTTFFALNGADKGRAKNINFTTGATLNVTLAGDTATITIPTGGGGTGTVTSVATAGLISGGPITTTGTITTSMNTNKLVGRSTAGVGIMEEITLGTGLSLTGTTLNVSSLTGSGASQRLAIWSGTSTLTSDARLYFNAAATGSTNGFNAETNGSVLIWSKNVGGTSNSLIIQADTNVGTSNYIALNGSGRMDLVTQDNTMYLATGTGDVYVGKLSGSGTRMVVSDAFGKLSTQALPGGGTILGTIANTQVAFGTAADTIGGSNNFIWDNSNNSLWFGTPTSGGSILVDSDAFAFGNAVNGTISAGNIGTLAFGQALSDGTIIASDIGGLAFGVVTGTSAFINAHQGALAFGIAEGDATVIEATDYSFAGGHAVNGAVIHTVGQTAFAFGYAADENSLISAESLGSVAGGLAQNEGTVKSTSNASFAWGYADGGGSQIEANGTGSLAIGIVTSGGIINAVGDGALAFGYADGGTLEANPYSLVFGQTANGGVIHTIQQASMAFGYAADTSSLISSEGIGSFAGGTAANSGLIRAMVDGSFAFGRADSSGSQITARGTGAFAIGTAIDGHNIDATDVGAFAWGYAINYNITAGAYGAFAGGCALDGEIFAGGLSSFAFGNDIFAANDFSMAFGTGYSNVTASTFTVGFGQIDFQVEAGIVTIPYLGGGVDRIVIANGGGELNLGVPAPVGQPYTPTLTNVTNITSTTANNATYSLVGTTVTVFGSFAVTTTLAVASQVDISLPIASNIGAATDINGLGQAGTAIATNIVITGDATNDRAKVNFIGLAVGGAGTIYYSFSYTVI